MTDIVEFPSTVDVEVLGSLHVAKFEGKFSSPHSRILYVEKEGKGDYTTITDAIAYASTGAPVDERAGKAAWLRWTILISAGEYEESFTVPNGVDLVGLVPYAARINGQVVQSPWCTFANLYFATPSANVEWAIHMDATGETSSSARPRLINCQVVNQNNAYDGGAEAVRISGGTTPTPIIYGMRGCFLYAANRYTGAGTAAKMQAIHWMSGANVVVEAFQGMHYKTSSGTTGVVKSPTLALIESTGYCYLHSDGTWNCENANDPNNLPRLVRSSSLIYHGLIGKIGFLGENGIFPLIESAYEPSTHRPLYSESFTQMRAEQVYVDDFRLPPIYRVTATVDPASMANGTATNVVVTVPGVTVFDSIGFLGFYSGAAGSEITVPNGVSMFPRITGANTVSIRFTNASGSTQDIPSGTVIFGVMKATV